MRKCVLFICIILIMTIGMYAGDLDSPDYPANTHSYTLEDIYQLLKYGTAASMSTFAEPLFGPTMSTGHSLNDIYYAADDALSKTQIPKTGQTTSYATGDDGHLEKGLDWPDPRFTNNYDGTITDNLTGLVWLKNAKPEHTMTWSNAVLFCNILENGNYGLVDGSSEGDWRLPNVRELQTLLDYSQISPCIPSGHPFTDLENTTYWTSTKSIFQPFYSWGVNLGTGSSGFYPNTNSYYVLPVRDGN